MNFDIDLARRDTPGCQEVVHFNSAGAALMPQVVVQAQLEHIALEAAIGGYEAKYRANDRIERVYGSIAELIHCDADEIAIVENATRAWDMAFYSFRFREGDRILTARGEYASNYIAYLQIARRTGAQVEVIPDDEQGQISIPALLDRIDERVKLISVTHVPTNNGLVNPAAEVGAVARRAGIPFLLDACQSIGQMPIDVGDIQCDMLSATGRKFLRGPRGTGFLYVRRGLIEALEPPFLDLHAAELVSKDEYCVRADARRFENWETNYAAKLGLGVAVEYALRLNIEHTWARIKALAERLRRRIAEVPQVSVVDTGAEKCGIVCFTVRRVEASQVRERLWQHNINVWVVSGRDTRFDSDQQLTDSVRASVHYYNTEDEVDLLCERLSAIL